MRDKIHIVIKSPTGGAWSLARKVAILLSQNGYDIEIVNFLGHQIPEVENIKTNSIFYNQFKDKKIPKVLVPFISLGLMMRWFLTVHPQKIISVGFPISVPLALMNMNECKQVILADTHISNHLKYKLKQKNSTIFRVVSKITHSQFIYRWMMSRVHHVICLTNAMANDLHNNYGLKKDKLSVIPPFINQDFFEQKRNKSDDKNTILYVGRLSDEKNIGDQLKVFQIILRERQTARFIIVGDGPEMQDLKKKAVMLGVENAVSFEGMQANIADYHTRASVQILSSHYEGFPLVLAEAQAAGVPVVCYDDIENSSEIVIDGVNGFIAPQGDVKKFAELIMKAFDYSWDYEAIQKSAEYLKHDKIAEQYLDLFKRL